MTLRDRGASTPIVFDTADPSGAALGALPTWDLTGLYPEPAAPAVEADFAAAETAATAFAKDYEGALASASGDALGEAIARYEQIFDRIGRASSFVYLRYSQNALDPERAKALGDAQARSADITAKLVFFELELNRIDDARLETLLGESARLAAYAPWIERVRAERPHQLSDELEKFLHDLSVVGPSAWVRLFDETIAGLTFKVRRGDEVEELAFAAVANLLTNPDRSVRAAAAAAMTEVFQANLPLFTRITNTLAKEKEIRDRWRSFQAPQSARHLSNQVEPDVVAALRDAVVAAYPRLSHRYYALKAKWLGLETLEHWDRNAPLPDAPDRAIPWSEAQDMVLSAYGDFAPRMADIARPFFEKNWIDAPTAHGKSPGAFAHPTVASAHPFVLLNYLGKARDVMTLAHELGHGVHQVLAAEQGLFLSQTPLTLAETASVFGEMLTFKRLLAHETDPARRKALLAGKVEDMINTVVRQIAFYEFESRVHAERRGGELTTEALGAIWLDVQRESLGPAFTFADGYDAYWCYVPHFIHAPFYVYAYAFGDGLVNALYAVYEEAQAAGDASFQEKYFAMLRAGGTLKHGALLAPFGLDAGDPAFWSKGLSVIEGMIDALEAMEA